MTRPTPSRTTPRLRDVAMEQLRVVSLALRWPAAVAASLAAAGTLMAVLEIVGGDMVVDFHPEEWMIPGAVGFALPLGVWMGEKHFGSGLLWTLPVERRRHALARVAAGWAWLMAAVGMFVLWLLALTLLSGGNVLGEETLQLLPSAGIPDPRTLDPAALRPVVWGPEPVLWLAPFTGATAAYLWGSALMLGVRHLVRWIVGVALGAILVSGLVSRLGQAANSEWMTFAPSRLLRALLFGPHGLEAVFTARTESLRLPLTLATGDTVPVWQSLPDIGEWATATFLWTACGLAVLWAAASRHRERRPPRSSRPT